MSRLDQPLAETLRRLLAVFALLPVGPPGLLAQEVLRRLPKGHQGVGLRTVQRDLKALRSAFPDRIKTRSPKAPFQWYCDRHAPLLQLPGMSVEAALALQLLGELLPEAFPRSEDSALQPYLEAARSALANAYGEGAATWLDKVRVLPRGLPVGAPKVEPSVLHAVYAALYEGRGVSVQYRHGSTGEERRVELAPLGLVLRSGSLVLVACEAGGAPRPFVLHRMLEATVIEAVASQPPDFSLDEFIASGGLGFEQGPPVKLVALVRPVLAERLRESPLAVDQELVDANEGWLRLSASVVNTAELEGWLMTWGEMVVVESPASVRNAVVERLSDALEAYGQLSPVTSRKGPHGR